MINKLIDAIIDKHGPVNIQRIKTGHGDFRIITKFNQTELITDCFHLTTGLINHLKKDQLK